MCLYFYLSVSVPCACRYTPSQQGMAYNSGSKQRIIRMVEAQKDPMDPPKFRTNAKIPRGPPSPPAPVLHSPTRKVLHPPYANVITNYYMIEMVKGGTNWSQITNQSQIIAF